MYPPNKPIQKIVALFPTPIKRVSVAYPSTFTHPNSTATDIPIEINKNIAVRKKPIMVIAVIGRNVNPKILSENNLIFLFRVQDDLPILRISLLNGT
jgi:hypothetical protein